MNREATEPVRQFVSKARRLGTGPPRLKTELRIVTNYEIPAL